MALENSRETALLKQYHVEKGGRLYIEVSIGGKAPELWEGVASRRWIDGVRLAHEDNAWLARERTDFLELLGADVPELIEIKTTLNRGVIGQILVAEEMFKAQFKVREVKLIILCEKGDVALEWFCRQKRIEVWKPKQLPKT